METRGCLDELWSRNSLHVILWHSGMILGPKVQTQRLSTQIWKVGFGIPECFCIKCLAVMHLLLRKLTAHIIYYNNNRNNDNSRMLKLWFARSSYSENGHDRAIVYV